MKRRRKAGSVGRQLLPCGSCSYFYLLPATRCGTEHIKSLLASFAGKLEKLSQRLESTQVLSSIPLTIVSFISTGTSASHAFPILPAPHFSAFSSFSCWRIATKRGDFCQLKRRVDVALAWLLHFLRRCFARAAFFNLSLESKVAKVVPGRSCVALGFGLLSALLAWFVSLLLCCRFLFAHFN